MTINTLQDILPLVERPSRYLGSEINTVRKDHSSVALRVALAFPDLYEIGMSHFGLQILYSILNRDPEIAAERVFAPDTDMEAYLRAAKIPLMSLETHTPLNRFDIVGFSLLYELNFTNIINMLDLAKIPLRVKDRDQSFPLIIAGGSCASNPEPLAEFVDAFVLGDGEAFDFSEFRVLQVLAQEIPIFISGFELVGFGFCVSGFKLKWHLFGHAMIPSAIE